MRTSTHLAIRHVYKPQHFGECGRAKNERGGLYITHVFDGGKAKPTVVVGEIIGYIVFTVWTR